MREHSTTPRRIAILQSNYIPWKGYFDMIASVDEFVLYDDAQFTKNDWRNRNKIKTPNGCEWLSVPAGTDLKRRIRDVNLPDRHWQKKHWRSLVANYQRARCFEQVAPWIEPLYLQQEHENLSALNRAFIETICAYLGIKTRISNSWDYHLEPDRIDRLVSICRQASAQEYVSGPAAKDYMDEVPFASADIRLSWFDYSGYPKYPQLWGDFEHGVSILDLLFNCGAQAPAFMRHVRPTRDSTDDEKDRT